MAAESTLIHVPPPKKEPLHPQHHLPHLSTRGVAGKKDVQIHAFNISKKPPPHKWTSSENLLSDNHVLSLCQHGLLDQALRALSLKDPSSPPLSHHTYISVLKLCSKRKSLLHAQQLHSHLAQHQVSLTGSLGDYLVVTLAKSGGLRDARLIHHTLPYRTVYSWTAIISAYVECGEGREALNVYHSMRKDGVEPDVFTYVSLFKACGIIPSLSEGSKLHKDARRNGFDMDLFVGASLITMYGKCGSIVEAENAFCELPYRDIVCWSAMLSAYAEQGQGEKALLVYRQMQQEGIKPDVQVYASAIQACETLGEMEESILAQGVKSMPLEIVQALHADARKKRFSSDTFVSTTLLSMYEKFGTIAEAENVFMALLKSHSATWTIMLAAYVRHNQGKKALQLYKQMLKDGVNPDEQTFVNALQACCVLAKDQSVHEVELISMQIVRALHADAHVKGFSSNVVIGTILVSLYGKYGSFSEAEDAFSELSQCDIMAWNTMLASYADQGEGEKALHLYKLMKRNDLTISDVTILCILQVCSEMGGLEMCREMHFTIVSAGCDQNISLINTLIHAYGSCASMADAKAVFDRLEKSDPVSWTACIAGYAGIGNSAACSDMFKQMLLVDMTPDAVTFASLLSACSHDGLVARGIEYFEFMKNECGVRPGLQHFSNLVNLLGRAGDFKRLESMLQEMNIQPDRSFWMCLMGACRTHNEVDIGKTAFYGAMSSQPQDGAAYILMSNIICDAGLGTSADVVEELDWD